MRHKITLGVIAKAPLRIRAGLFYVGSSGRPYTYMISGDANADGLSLIGLGNDIMYVPRNAADITLADPDQWPGLDSLIRGQPCLQSQRGRIMRRNSCQGRWATLLNARLSKVFGMGGGHSLELITDRVQPAQSARPGLGGPADDPLVSGRCLRSSSCCGYDQANQRGVYNVASDRPQGPRR